MRKWKIEGNKTLKKIIIKYFIVNNTSVATFQWEVMDPGGVKILALTIMVLELMEEQEKLEELIPQTTLHLDQLSSNSNNGRVQTIVQ